LIAGVLDLDGVKTDIINKNDLNYINSGVMLMNLGQFTKTNYQEKIEDIMIYNSAQILSDQCIFNKLAVNKKLIINKKFNFLVYPNLISEEERKIIKNLKEKEIKIIHFVGPIKPWMEWCNPLLSDFYSYYSNKLQNIDIKLKKINNMLLTLEYVSVLDKNSYYAKSSEIKCQIIKKLKLFKPLILIMIQN
jgi:lipopolysaccharide biosynthesis glycosyltransferase